MQTTFRTTLSPADIGRMIGGALLMFITLPTLIASPFWIAALGMGSNGGGLAGLPLLAFVAGLAWMGWNLMPPFRRAELTLRSDGVAVGAYGWRHDLPWPAVRSLRIEMIRVAHRLPGNGPSMIDKLFRERVVTSASDTTLSRTSLLI